MTIGTITKDPKQEQEKKKQGTRLRLSEWPKRDSSGIGISFKDGWNFGLGVYTLGCILTLVSLCALLLLISVGGGAAVSFVTSLAAP